MAIPGYAFPHIDPQLEATPSIHEDVVSGTTGLGLDIHLHELLGTCFSWKIFLLVRRQDKLVGDIPTHLKNMSSSVGIMTSPIYLLVRFT